MNVTFTRIDGTAIAVDPTTVSAVVAMSAAQSALSGISTGNGTVLTVSGAAVQVRGDVPDVLALLNGASPGPSTSSVATRTALAAIAAADRSDGQIVTVRSDGSRWIFDATSTAAADMAAPNAVTAAAIALVPTVGAGRWIRAEQAIELRIPFIAADVAGVKWTCPVGFAVRLASMPYWDIVQSVAGDGARRLCASSSNLGAFTTAGDLLGPVGGLAQGTLVVGQIPGTVGVDFSGGDTANTSLAIMQSCLWRAGETIRLDVPAAGTDTIAGMLVFPVIVERLAGTLPS